MGGGDYLPRRRGLGEEEEDGDGGRLPQRRGGKGCCSPLSPEMGKPDVGGDVRDGAAAAGDPTARVGALLADPPALCDSGCMGGVEGGKRGGGCKSPQQQGALACARPLSKQNTAGRGALGLHILAEIHFGQKNHFHPVYPAWQQRETASRSSPGLALPSRVGKALFPKVTEKAAEKQPSEEAVADSPFPPLS